MRIRWFWSISVALVLAIALVLTGCGGGGGGQGGGGGGGSEQITVASDIAYPPFEFEKKEAGGLRLRPDARDRQAGRLYARVPERHLRRDHPRPWQQPLRRGASAFTITEAREKKVDFSDPTSTRPVAHGPERLPIKSVDDIGDGTVGVQLGTTGELKAKEFEQQGKITGEVRTFDTITEAFSALENGQIEAVINDFPISAYFAKTGGGSLGSRADHPDRRAVRHSLPKGQRSPRAHQQGARGDKEGRHLRRDIREVVRRET